MPSWFTTFDPMFGQGEGAHRAFEALQRFAKLLQIPKTAAWAVHKRGIGLVVVAEWPYDELWVGQTCLICGETGPLHEHVHPERRGGEKLDEETGLETLEKSLRKMGKPPRA